MLTRVFIDTLPLIESRALRAEAETEAKKRAEAYGNRPSPVLERARHSERRPREVVYRTGTPRVATVAGAETDATRLHSS